MPGGRGKHVVYGDACLRPTVPAPERQDCRAGHPIPGDAHRPPGFDTGMGAIRCIVLHDFGLSSRICPSSSMTMVTPSAVVNISAYSFAYGRKAMKSSMRLRPSAGAASGGTGAAGGVTLGATLEGASVSISSFSGWASRSG